MTWLLYKSATVFSHRFADCFTHLGSRVTETFQRAFSAWSHFYYSFIEKYGLLRPSTSPWIPSYLSFYSRSFTNVFFFRGNLAQVLSVSLRNHRPLVMYFHSDNCGTPNPIISNILTNDLFLSILKESNVILFSCHSCSEDARVLSTLACHIKKFPTLIFCSPLKYHESTESRLLVDNHTVLHTWENICVTGIVTISNAELQIAVDLLTQTIEATTFQASLIKEKKKKVLEDRQLREKQQEAYQRALKKDQERGLEKQQESFKSFEGNAENNCLAKKRNQLTKDFFAQLFLSKLHPSEMGTNSETSYRHENRLESTSFMIKLRLESGITVTRLCEGSMPLAYLFAWVDSLPLLWNGSLDSRIKFLGNIITSNPLFKDISGEKLNALLEDKKIIDQICGISSSPDTPITQIPLHYHLVTSSPTLLLNRPVFLDITLKNSGLTNHVNLFLRPQN